MTNNQGFVATSLLYSFFLIFCALLLALVGSFMHNRVLLDRTVDNIKKDLSNMSNKNLSDVEVGNYVTMPIFSSKSELNINDVKWMVYMRDTENKTVSLVSTTPVYATLSYRNPNLFSEEAHSFYNLYSTGSTSGNYVRPIRIDDINIFYNADISFQKVLLNDGEPFIYYNPISNNVILDTYTCGTSECFLNNSRVLDSQEITFYGVRLVATLKDTTPIASGSGTAGNPYNLLYNVYQRDNNNILKLHYDNLNPTKNLGFKTVLNTLEDLSGNNHAGTLVTNHTNNLNDGIAFSSANSLQTGLQICSIINNSNGYTIELVSKKYMNLAVIPSNQKFLSIAGNGSSVSFPNAGVDFGDVTRDVFHTYTFIKKPSENVMVYIDGKYKYTSDSNNLPCSANDILYLGAYIVSSTTYPGNIKSLRIYDTALTESEIRNNYSLDQRWLSI